MANGCSALRIVYHKHSFVSSGKNREICPVLPRAFLSYLHKGQKRRLVRRLPRLLSYPLAGARMARPARDEGKKDTIVVVVVVVIREWKSGKLPKIRATPGFFGLLKSGKLVESMWISCGKPPKLSTPPLWKRFFQLFPEIPLPAGGRSRGRSPSESAGRRTGTSVQPTATKLRQSSDETATKSRQKRDDFFFDLCYSMFGPGKGMLKIE